MKSVFWSFFIFAGLMLAYWIDLFGFFAKKGALAWAFALVMVIFLVGCKVLGNPFSAIRAEDEDYEDK